MIFKQATIAAISATLCIWAGPAIAQTTPPSERSGADFSSGSPVKKQEQASPAKDSDADVGAAKAKGQDAKEAATGTEAVKGSSAKPEEAEKAEKEKAESSETADAASKPAKPETKKTSTASDAPEKGAKPEKAETAKTEPDTKPASLTVASWGGAYTESQKRAYFSPFEVETGIAITTVSHNGRFDPLKEPEDAASTAWDIVDIDLSTLESACKDGRLEKVATTALVDTKDGKPASSDFLPGTLHECGIPSVAWSSAIVFDRRAFKKAKPKTARDFFDTKRFPGKRALPRDPKYVVELALMAAGVKPENVYEELSKEDGLTQAFDQLDLIRDDVLWWDKAHQPLKQLARKDAAIALAFNGRIFSAIVAENRPFGIIWDGQVFNLDFWAIPKGSSRKEASLKFIAFATRPESLARQASWFPYGPVRKSAVELVGEHPEVNVDMTAYIPTAPANFKRALRLNTLWWKENGKKIRDRYESWIDGTFDSSSFEDEQQ